MTLKAILTAGRAARRRNPEAGALAERMAAISPACSTRRPLAPPELSEGGRQPHVSRDVDLLGPALRRYLGGRQKGLRIAELLQRLPEHLPALSESRGRHGLQKLRPAGQGVGPRSRRTMLDITFGWGTKAEGGTLKRIFAVARQPASTDSRP